MPSERDGMGRALIENCFDKIDITMFGQLRELFQECFLLGLVSSIDLFMEWGDLLSDSKHDLLSQFSCMAKVKVVHLSRDGCL